MPTAGYSIWLTVLALLLAPQLPATGLGQRAVPPSERGLYGLPARLRSLADLGLVARNRDLTPLQKTEVEIAWLVEERRVASPTTRGLGGGPIDSDYIQRQLIVCLGVDGDPGALDLLLNSGEFEDQGIRDALCLALAFNGDKRQIQPLIAMLKSDPSPGHRYLAAERLEVWPKRRFDSLR
jgi:hypothetical protein